MFSVAVPIPTLPPVPKDINRPELQINCLADGILVQINLKDDNFKGVMATAMISVAAQELESGIDDFKVLFGVCVLFHSDVSSCILEKIHYEFMILFREKPTSSW